MFEILFIVAALAEIPLVAWFLKIYWPKRTIHTMTRKIICSSLFVLCGVFAIKATGNNTLYADYILWGLILGMVGDIFLHSIKGSNTSFAIGVLSFLAGHVFYIMALQRAIYTTGFSKGAFTWYEILIVAFFAVVALVYCIKTTVFQRKGIMAYGVLIYGVVLSIMLAKAIRYVIGEIAFGVNDNMVMVTVTVGLGAILFALSDISLGLILSSDKPRVRSHRIFNIITYYAAQVLLAASIFFVYSRELY